MKQFAGQIRPARAGNEALRRNAARTCTGSGAALARSPWVAAVVLSLNALWVPGLAACNTGAVAISECREIEFARCEAAKSCGVIDDVDACQRFYRDQCLHGIAGPEAPTADQRESCVELIQVAGSCAQDDPEMTLAECRNPPPSGTAGAAGAPSFEGPTVCQVIDRPWTRSPCDFVNPGSGMGGGN